MARAGQGVENADFSDFCLVTFNLGTRGLWRDAQIWKIGACTETHHFQTYTKLVNDTWLVMTVVIDLEDVDVSVDTGREETLINKFLEFLRTRDQSRPVILVAHNAYGFHGPRILRLVKRLGMMAEFQSRVAGFACTLLLFENELSDSERGGNTLREIANNMYGFNWGEGAAYNATRKAQILWQVIDEYDLENKIPNYTASVQAVLRRVETLDRKASLKRISRLSDYMREKIAKAGIDYENLEEAYQFGSDDGVIQLLQNNGVEQDVGNIILEHLRVSVPGTLQPIV